ncbi:MAG: DUF4327 family protein [Cyanobacteria bacterium P01_H01_bin.15]
MTNQVAHPMVKLQRKVASLLASNVLKADDQLWKIAFLLGDKWPHWKEELQDFGFSMQDTIAELSAVESWDDE